MFQHLGNGFFLPHSGFLYSFPLFLYTFIAEFQNDKSDGDIDPEDEEFVLITIGGAMPPKCLQWLVACSPSWFPPGESS
jgi:hypothetical protein